MMKLKRKTLLAARTLLFLAIGACSSTAPQLKLYFVDYDGQKAVGYATSDDFELSQCVLPNSEKAALPGYKSCYMIEQKDAVDLKRYIVKLESEANMCQGE